jgi:LacI family transcriptional regulator
VGIAGTSAKAAWFTELLDGMERVLSRRAASVAICALEREGLYDPAPVKAWIENRSVDQLVLVRPGTRESALAAQAWSAGIKVVSLVPDVVVNRGLSIIANNLRGGRLAAEHLRALGHDTICFLGGPQASIDTQDRLRGLCEHLNRPIPETLVRYGKSYDIESGVELANTWLSCKRLRSATAVVLGNDSLALGFMRTIQATGVRIPQDVSVLGFDGVAAGALVWPGLTTVAQPVSLMGAELAETLLSDSADEELEKRMTRTYQLNLVIRESTGAPRPCK